MDGQTTTSTPAPVAAAPAPVASPSPPAVETKPAAAAAPAAEIAKPAADSFLDGDKAETKPADGESTETKDAKPAPALVDDKWEPKAVEGLTRDAKVFGEAKTLFAKLGLNAEQAQALVDFSDAQSKLQVAAQSKSLDEVRNTARADWWKELQADKELGGANLPQSKANFQRAIRSLGGNELATALREMGLDNFPPLVRAFEKAGRLMAEDTVSGTVTDKGKPVGDPFERQLKSAYPTMHKES